MTAANQITASGKDRIHWDKNQYTAIYNYVDPILRSGIARSLSDILDDAQHAVGIPSSELRDLRSPSVAGSTWMKACKTVGAVLPVFTATSSVAPLTPAIASIPIVHIGPSVASMKLNQSILAAVGYTVPKGTLIEII